MKARPTRTPNVLIVFDDETRRAACAPAAKILRAAGWRTFWVGRHQAMHPHELGAGFDRVYGFIGGETNGWLPDLVEDHRFVDRPYPSAARDDVRSAHDLADKAIGFLRDARLSDPDTPWLLWLTGFSKHTDTQVGRIVDYLDASRQLDHTIIFDGADSGTDIVPTILHRCGADQQEQDTMPKMPNMPPRNPWLTDSVYPVSHMNPAATDAVPFAGPRGGGQLTRDQVKAISVLFVSNPTVKKVGNETVVLAPGTLGIQKIIATGDAFELVHVLPYPGLEERARQADDKAIAAALAEVDAARRTHDDMRLAAIPEMLAKLGLDYDTGINGVYNLIDKDGFHYCVYGGVSVLKTTDDNKAHGPMRIVKSGKITTGLPPDLAKQVTRVIGAAMTYDGHIALVSPGALVVIDRELNVRDALGFAPETVDNSIAVDENGGIYVVTSNRMIKTVWTGRKISTNPRDGAWESEYNTMSSDKALSLGAVSRGSGTTPTLMGFGDDPDKLVIIADADERGTNAVAFWRDEIPEGFRQKPGTKSRRIADQIRIDISKLTIEPSPEVLGYGVAFLNSTYPKPAKIPGIGNAFVSGVTRPAPLGIQKFIWNTDKKAFEKAWTNREIDNTDWMVPVISATTNELYAAHKDRGNYQYVGIDWNTGAIKDRWEFPDDSRAWNSFGGITAILENGDLMLGGVFALKRVHMSTEAHP